MSTIRQRLAALALSEAAMHPQEQRIFVFFEGEESGTCDGIPMTFADFEATATATDIVITVNFRKPRSEVEK